MATMYDVAKRAGVSQTAVSAVLNGKGKNRVGPEKQKLIWEAVKELGYRPNHVAKQLATGKSDTIAVCFERPVSRAWGYIEPIGETISAERYHLFIASSAIYAGLKEMVEGLPSHGVGGIIVIGPIFAEKSTVEAIENCQVPIVCMDNYPFFNKASAVGVDFAGAMKEGTNYLVHEGHYRIEYIGPPPLIQVNSDKIQGFCEALQENNLPVIERSIRLLELERVGDFLIKELESPDKPTALVCGTTAYGMEAYKAIRACGLRIPDDISLLVLDGFPKDLDDSDAVSRIVFPGHDMAKKAAEVLMRIISGELNPPVNVRLPIDLHLRPSPVPKTLD